MTHRNFVVLISFLILIHSQVIRASEVKNNVSIYKCCDFDSKIDNQTGKCGSHQNHFLLQDGENVSFLEEAEKLLSTLLTGNASRYQLHLIHEFNCPTGDLKRISFGGNEFNAQKSLFISQDKLQLKDKLESSQELCLESTTNDATAALYICDTGDSPTSTNNIINDNHKNTSTLRKCCKQGESVNRFANHFSCIPSRYEQWNPTIFKSIDEDLYNNSSSFVEVLKEGYGFPNCSFKLLNNSEDIWFKTLEDGSVLVGLKFWFRPVWLKVSADSACLDTTAVNDRAYGSHSAHFQHFGNISVENDLKNEILLYCNLEQFDDYVFHRKLFGSLCIISSVLILFLLLIYASIWNKQNMAGLTQFNLFTSLLVVFGMEGLRVLVQPNGLDAKQTNTCFIIAAVAQYFFFTVNTTWSVMCFDLFWTFWRLESGDIPATKHPKRITVYFMVSWIVPLISTTIAFFTVHMKENDSSASNKMSFAHRRCSSPIRELGFTTQGIFFLINLLFFLFTAIFIWKHQRSMRSVKRANVMKSNWLSVKLFLKLLVVMGVASLTIPLDFFFGSNDPLSFYSTFIRVSHFIPSWAAFWIFGFNERNVKMLRKKFPFFRKFWDSFECNKRGFNTSIETAHGGPSPSTIANGEQQRSSC